MSFIRQGPRRIHLALAAALAPLALVLAYGGCREAAAQHPRQFLVPDSVYTRVPQFSPKSGPPGTVVRVETVNLPAITPVYVSLGGTRSGFEVLAALLTTPRGEITTTVQIPDWATRDRSHAFIVMDVYFRPLAMSPIFYVTDRDGLLSREGRIIDEGGPCPSLLGADGVAYRLSGDTEGLAAGDEVIVEGVVAEASSCGQGASIKVVRFQRPENQGPVETPRPMVTRRR